MSDKTRKIMERLASLGVSSTYLCGITHDMDGEIQITPTVTVHVGSDYLSVKVANSATEPTVWRDYPIRSHRQLNLLVEDIKMAGLFDFNAKPVFQRLDKRWCVEIYHGPNGGCIIERWRGPQGVFPFMWQHEATPDEWVGMQRDKAKYMKVVQEASCR